MDAQNDQGRITTWNGSDVMVGYVSNDTNAFGWERVALNLPGDPLYNPGRPRVMKLRSDGLLAADIVTFYNDGRVLEQPSDWQGELYGKPLCVCSTWETRMLPANDVRFLRDRGLGPDVWCTPFKTPCASLSPKPNGRKPRIF